MFFLLRRYNSKINNVEYLVKWAGYDVTKSTWVSQDNIFASTYLEDFENEWKSRPKSNKQLHFEVAEKVWVKLKGHQWWPAQIVTSTVHICGHNYLVIYYLDNTFSYVNDYTPSLFTIERFEGNEQKYYGKRNQAAVEEAKAMLDFEPEII